MNKDNIYLKYRQNEYTTMEELYKKLYIVRNKIIDNKYQLYSNNSSWKRDKKYLLIKLVSKLRKQ